MGKMNTLKSKALKSQLCNFKISFWCPRLNQNTLEFEKGSNHKSRWVEKWKYTLRFTHLLKKLWGHTILKATLAHPLEAASYHASIKNTKSRNSDLRCGHQEWPTQGGDFFTKMSNILFSAINDETVVCTLKCSKIT